MKAIDAFRRFFELQLQEVDRRTSENLRAFVQEKIAKVRQSTEESIANALHSYETGMAKPAAMEESMSPHVRDMLITPARESLEHLLAMSLHFHENNLKSFLAGMEQYLK